MSVKTGYANGSDMLLYVNGKAIGHCSSHTVTINSETKDRAVKPVATKGIEAGLWKNKGVTGLSVSISAESLVFYQETETGYRACLAPVMKGQVVEVKCMERESEKPYLTGKFVIASLEMSAPAQDDVTYNISLENDGQVSYDESALTQTAEAGNDVVI